MKLLRKSYIVIRTCFLGSPEVVEWSPVAFSNITVENLNIK